MAQDVQTVLRNHGINPSAQRVAVAQYVLHTDAHPSADEVLARVRRTFPMVSRATVYNTLNLFVRQGLLRQFVLTEGRVVFDPHIADHHHFVDDASGAIVDLPWDSLKVQGLATLDEFAISEYQVVVRGRRKQRTPKA